MEYALITFLAPAACGAFLLLGLAIATIRKQRALIIQYAKTLENYRKGEAKYLRTQQAYQVLAEETARFMELSTMLREDPKLKRMPKTHGRRRDIEEHLAHSHRKLRVMTNKVANEVKKP